MILKIKVRAGRLSKLHDALFGEKFAITDHGNHVGQLAKILRSRMIENSKDGNMYLVEIEVLEKFTAGANHAGGSPGYNVIVDSGIVQLIFDAVEIFPPLKK